MNTLAIDQGTSSTRAVLLDDNGDIRVTCVLEHRQSYPQNGWVEHDPEELIANIRRCLDASGDVSAIGICNQGESCLAWDRESMQALSPVIVWQDARTQDTVERLKANGLAPLVLEKAGLPLDPYFSASKLAWLMTNNPRASVLLRSGKLGLGTTDTFFLQRLTGRYVTDVTTASRTSLMNLRTCEWDQELCEIFGVPIETLPTIVPSTGDFGSARVGTHDVPITASIVDQQASLFGHGCREAGDAKITFGTGAFALTLTGNEPIASKDGLLPTIAWQLAGERAVYALDGGVYCASSAVNWARSLGLFADFADINAFQHSPAIERNIAFVPALSGLACPHWQRDARGTWLGLSLNTTSLDMVQALLEGVALRASEVLESMAEHASAQGPLSIDGGMTANPYFCQFLCDVLQREVAAAAFPDITGFGTALLAAGETTEATMPSGTQRAFIPKQRAGQALERFRRAVAITKSWQINEADTSTV